MERDPALPHLLGSPPFDLGGSAVTGELAMLERLALAGVPLAPIVAVPAAAEERFYRLNNLPVRIHGLFEGVSLDDPDEDDIEELAPQVRALLRSHYLLDEEIDAFYEATRRLGDRVRVRRPGSSGAVAAAGRSALLALKRCWEDAWQPDVLLARLHRDGMLAPEATPLLIHGADAALPDAAVRSVQDALDGRLVAFGLADGRVSRIMVVT